MISLIDGVLVVSIPIIILRKTQMKTSQKVSLGVFLCLSCVMAVAALTRAAGYRVHGVIDFTWEIFWQWMECGIAVIMGSAAAFRTLFVQDQIKEKNKGPSYSMRQRLMQRWKRSYELSLEDGEQNLPQIPSATLSGLRTFLRRNNRSAGATTFMRSEFDDSDELTGHDGGDRYRIHHSRGWDVQSTLVSEDQPTGLLYGARKI